MSETYSAKEERDRKVLGYESHPIEYKEIHLIIQDEFMHTLNLFEPKNPKRLKYPESIYPDEEI